MRRPGPAVRFLALGACLFALDAFWRPGTDGKPGTGGKGRAPALPPEASLEEARRTAELLAAHQELERALE